MKTSQLIAVAICLSAGAVLYFLVPAQIGSDVAARNWTAYPAAALTIAGLVLVVRYIRQQIATGQVSFRDPDGEVLGRVRGSDS